MSEIEWHLRRDATSTHPVAREVGTSRDRTIAQRFHEACQGLPHRLIVVNNCNHDFLWQDLTLARISWEIFDGGAIVAIVLGYRQTCISESFSEPGWRQTNR